MQSPRPKRPTQRAQAGFPFSLLERPGCPRALPACSHSLRAVQAFPPPVPTRPPPFFGPESLRIPPSASLCSRGPHSRRRTSPFPRAARRASASLLPLPQPHRANPVPAPKPDSPAADSQDLLPSPPSVSRADFRMPRLATRHQSLQVRDALQLRRQSFRLLLPQSALRVEPLELVRGDHVSRISPYP